MHDKFSLKWHDFETNISNSFRKLRNTDDFYDVTLVSDDQEQMLAHKVVLSASSEYFNTVLKSNKHSHPMICLNGINSIGLTNILDYIYNGEVEIKQDQLKTFLECAKRFQLEGLVEEPTENIPEITNSEEESGMFEEFFKVLELDQAKTSKRTSLYKSEPLNAQNFEEMIEKHEQSLKKQTDGTYVCVACGKETKNSSHMKEHIEVHLGMSFNCPHCEKAVGSRPALRTHMRKSCRNKSS